MDVVNVSLFELLMETKKELGFSSFELEFSENFDSELSPFFSMGRLA